VVATCSRKLWHSHPFGTACAKIDKSNKDKNIKETFSIKLKE
jgi:hypothetical protein